MISIIICSVKPVLAENLKKNIDETVGIKYEVIIIDNRQNEFSIASAYNAGAKMAKFSCLCFVHEDIEFHTQGWGQKLVNHLADNAIALVGILGCTIKTKSPSGVFIPVQQLNRVNQLQRTRTNSHEKYYFNPYGEERSGVMILDGIFLSTTKQRHEKYPFDENLLTGFHGYDIDFSLGQSLYGKVVVIYDILIEHFSYGGNTAAWIEAQLKVSEKWRKRMPMVSAVNIAELSNAEIVNTTIFLKALFDNRYSKWVQLKYMIILFKLQPFSVENLRMMARFLLGKRPKWVKAKIPDKF